MWSTLSGLSLFISIFANLDQEFRLLKKLFNKNHCFYIFCISLWSALQSKYFKILLSPLNMLSKIQTLYQYPKLLFNINECLLFISLF